jgi:hypothetical protein
VVLQPLDTGGFTPAALVGLAGVVAEFMKG